MREGNDVSQDKLTYRKHRDDLGDYYFLDYRDNPLESEAEHIVEVQRALNNLGFSAGSLDGILNSQTVAAIKNFQRSEDIKPTGELCERTEITLIREIESRDLTYNRALLA